MKLKIYFTFVQLFYISFFSYTTGTVYKAQVCEGHTLRLSCYLGQKISILSADYGRWDASVCPYYEDPNMRLDCHSEFALFILKAQCEGHRTCALDATNENFMDPCSGQIKYAEVKYICVKKTKNLNIPAFFFDESNDLNEKDSDYLHKKALNLFMNQ